MKQIGSSIGDENKTSQDSGVFNSILNTVEKVGEKALDVGGYIKDQGEELLGTGVDLVKDTAKAGVNLVKEVSDKGFGILSNAGELYSTSKKQEFNDFDKKQAEKLNSLGGIDMASGILGVGKSLIKSGKESLFGNEITNNLKVDKNEFNDNINQYTSNINTLTEQLNKLDKSKYNTYLSFEDKVKQQYLKDKGLVDIQDESDFELYKRKELERLDAYSQSSILREQQLYIQETGKIYSELNSKQEELKTYLNNSINPIGEKTGEQLYNEFNENKDKELKDNEYIKTIGEIHEYSKQQVEDGLEAKGLAKVSDWAGYDSMKDAIIDDVSTENQYYMSVLGMKDLPDYEVFANKAKEIRDVSYKFKIDYMNNYMNLRNNEEYKGMNDIDVKNAIQKLTWDKMSLEDKQVYKQKEKLITEVSALKNYTEMKERTKNLDPRALIDLVSGITASLQTVINNAYDFDSKDVPHFVKQDMRNIVYAGEGIGKNIISALTYNPDALVTILLGTKGLDKVAGAAKGIQSLSKTLLGADKIAKMEINVAGAKGVLTLASKTIKNLTTSQLYGTVGDVTLDNVMVEAPTKAIESFNMISNMLFDTTPFVYKEAKSGLEQSTTLNKISYDYFINSEDKNAIKQFADIHKIDEGSAKVILDNGVKGLYSNLFNPKEYKSLMKTPGALYKFVGDNINKMDQAKVSQILTEKGIGLKQEAYGLDGLSYENKLDITDAWNKSQEKINNDYTVNAQFNKARLNDLLDLYKGFITPGKGGAIDAYKIGISYKINSNAAKDTKFNELYNNAIDALKDIKIAETKEQFDKAFNLYNNNLIAIRDNYSNIKKQKYIRIVNPIGGEDIQVNINDLYTWVDKNLFDLMKDGKVKIIKKDSSFFGKETRIRTEQEINSEKFIGDYLEKQSDRIKAFEIENNLLLKNQSIESTIKNLLIGNKDKESDALVRNFFGDLSKEEEKEKMHKVVGFINDMLGEIVGSKYIKDKPNFINKSIKDIDKETQIAKMQEIKDLANKDDSYLNLSYGYFKPKGKDNYMFAMYILPGKKILDDGVIARGFTGKSINKKGEVVENITHLRNQSKDIISKIMTLGFTNKGFDFDRGLLKTKSLYSMTDTKGLFRDGKLDEHGIYRIVKDIYGDKDGLENIQDFVFKTLEDITESESIIIKPIIYNLAYNYSTNKKLIDVLISKQVGNFEEIFSDLLLSPQLTDLIVKKLVNRSGLAEKDFIKINPDLEKLVETEWNIYVKKIGDRKDLLEQQKKELEGFLDNELDSISRENILKEIETIDNRIKAINTDGRREGKFKDQKTKQYLTEMYYSLIKRKTDNIGGEALGTIKKIFTGEEIKSLNDLIETQKKIINSAINGSDKYKNNIKELLKIIDSDDASRTKTLDFISKIEDPDLKKYFNNVIELHKNFGDIPQFVRDDSIFDNLTETAISGKLNHEWALENNPIKRKLNAFLNNSPTGQDDLLNKKIINYFEGNNYIDLDLGDIKIINPDNILKRKENEAVYDLLKNNQDSLNKITKGGINKKYFDLIKTGEYVIVHHATRNIDSLKKIINSGEIIVNKNKDFPGDPSGVFFRPQESIPYTGEYIIEFAVKKSEINNIGGNIDDSYVKYNITSDKFISIQKSISYNRTNINGDKDIIYSNIDDLYKNSNKFKKFIRSLNLENGEDPKEAVHNFRKILKDLLSSEIVKTNKSDNIADELIDELVRDRKLFSRFKNLKNREKLIAGEGNSAINIKISKGYSGRNIIDFEEEKYVDKVIQFENMKNYKVDFQLLNGLSSKSVRYFEVGNRKGNFPGQSLSSKIRDYYNSLKDKFKDNEEGYLKAISQSPVTELKVFADVFNKNTESLGYQLLSYNPIEKNIDENLGKENRERLLKNSRLKEYQDKGYVFVGGLGDKDSNMHLYKMPKEFDNLISSEERNKLQLLIYNAEYAYANGYIKFDRDFTTFEDFKKELLKNLGEGTKSYKTIEDKFMKLSDKNLVDLDVIRKREASNASNFKTFGEYKEPVKLYIIDPVIDKDNALYKFKSPHGKIEDFLGGLNESSKNNFENFINEFILESNEIASRIKKELEVDGDYDKVLTYINNTYANDLQDGTSFVSEYLTKLRGYLNGLSKKEVESLEYKQFKDHFFGENKETNGVRVFGKTLFNSSEIKEGGEVIQSGVAIGKSSLKLGKDIYKNAKETIITIDGKEYKAKIIEGTDTSFFKNAATDLFDHEEEQTFSDSIKASLSDIASKKITELQKNQIQDLFKKLLSGLGDFSLDINSYSSLDKYVNDVSAMAQIGYSSSSMLGSRLTEFLSGVDRIINKPQDKGQSMFIRESSLKIKTNEVIMHRDSQIVKQIFDEVRSKMYPGLDKLNTEQTKEVYNNLFTIGYRYPVPSKYNIGVYKIRFSDEFSEYERMGTNQVVPHPETTYMKLEGDNDGDHIFFISTNTDFGKIVSEDVLNKNLGDKVYETLTKEGFDNDFIVISQVEKIGGDKGKEIKEYKDLLKSRISAVEAKSYIGNVSATIRTIKLLDKLKDPNYKLVKTTQDGENNFIYSVDTLKGIQKKLFKGNEFKISEREFAANAAQLLQATLDFGNSGLDQFNPEWFMQLLNQVFPKTMNNLDKFKVQSELISALSMGYKGNEFKASAISSTTSALKKKVGLSDKQIKTLNKNLYGIVGDKRELLEFLYSGIIKNENGKSIIIGDLISNLNKTQDFSWIINNVLKDTKNKTLGKFVKQIQDDFLFKNYGYVNEKFGKNIIGLIDEEKDLFKDYKIFKEFKKYLYEDNKSKKELLGQEVFSKILKLDKEERFTYALYGLLNKEYKVLNFALGQEVKDFLQYSDQKFLDRLDKEITDGWINIPKTISKEKKELMVKELINELDNSINTLKAIDSEDTLFIDNKILELENVKARAEDILKQSEVLEETEKNVIKQYKQQEDISIPQEYNIPGIGERLIDISKDGVNELISESEGFVNKSINNLSGFVSAFFGKYIPKFLADYNNLNDLLGHKEKAIVGSVADRIKIATNHNLYDFNEYLDKEGILNQIKNTGLNDYKEFGKKIQYELIDYVNGKYVLKDIEKVKDTIKKHFEGTKGSSLIDNQKFIDRLTNYQTNVIDNIAYILNNLEAQGYKVFENYQGGEAYSLITDVIEAHKADTQLALRLNGFKNRNQFEKFISEQVDKEGGRAMKGTIKTMSDVLYSTQGEWYDKILGFLKGTHYSMTYGTGSLITGNGIMSGLAQMLPNYVELRSYFRKNLTDIKEGYTVMQRLGLLDSESVAWFGSSIGKDLESEWIDGTIEKIMYNLNLGNIKSNKAATLLHSFLTNPLGGTDYPIENLRKCVAITNTMKSLGIKNTSDLERRIRIYGKDFEGTFRSEVRKQFAESGGGVNSSSAIYKDTIFNHLHNYADIWGVRFLTQSLGYLMGWSYHKGAKLIEKESTLYYGMKDLFKGNYKGFKAHIDDWFTYNSMIAHQAMMALGIFMKMEKYEKDTNDGVSFEEFRSTFMNSIVSINILLEKHLNAWETADEYSGTLQDKVGYTTVGLVRNAFRLFGQTGFIATMYKHYVYSQIEGKANLFNSLQFAMNQHYTGYIRFNGLEAMDNMYNTLTNESKLAMLGTGARTSEEEMFKKLQDGNYFGMYKDKGFIKGMYDMFDGLLLKSSTSVPIGLQNKISKDLVKLVMEDKELSKLIRGGQFGTGNGDYNIERLYGKVGSSLTEEQIKGVNDLYKQFSDYNYNYLDSTGIKADTYTQSSLDRMLHEQIDSALKKEGINMEELISKSSYSPELLKTLAVLESKYGLKNPLVISLMIDNEYNKGLSELKNKQGKLTGQVSQYGTAYKEVLEEDKIKLKRDLLIKYQEYFNLNRQIGMDIISQDIQMNHKDKLENIKNIIDKYGNSQKDMEQYLKSSYLIGQVAKEGNTSVSKLHSRYALASKGLANNETTAKIVNTFLNKLFNNESLSNKEKLANAAGFLSGLDKATYGMLSNNEEFNKLTDDSKKLLMNWVFKINKEAIDYDSSTYLNELNANAYGGNGSGSSYRKLYPKYKSKSFEGGRPGFSKQFSPLQKMLRPEYIDKDSNGYIRKYNEPHGNYNQYNNLRSPIMRKYKDLLIEQLFYGYKSKGIIKQYPKKIDKIYKKDIKIKKAKPIKKPKEKTKPKKYIPYKQNLYSGPLNTYVGD